MKLFFFIIFLFISFIGISQHYPDPDAPTKSRVADVIFGDYEITGKLSHTWPASFNDVPVNIYGNNQGQNILFNYRFGLTYQTNVVEHTIQEKDLL